MINTWDKLKEIPNPALRVLIEANPGLYLPCGSDWTSEGSNAYSHACMEVKVSSATDDGAELTVKTSLAQVQGQAGSYWFDTANQIIYVRCFDDDDLSNSSTTTVIVAWCWKYFSTDVCEFNGIQYMPVVRQNSLPMLDISVDDIVEGLYKFNFGSFSLNNPGWFDIDSVKYLWANCFLNIKVGGEQLPYSEYRLWFLGKISDVYVGDEEGIFTVKDIRVGTYSQLPIDHYWKGAGSGEYPNLPDEDHGKVIPLFYGRKENIVPICIDPTQGTGGRWKIAGRQIKAINEVRWVHDDWKEVLTAGTDYTIDLNNAQFDLNIAYDPTSEFLEVDAEGFVDGSSNLYTQAGEISLDTLQTYLEFPDSILNLPSFANIDSKRTQELCIYLDTEVGAREFLQTIGRSVLGFFAPTEDGKLAFQIYESTTPVSVLKFANAEYHSWRVKMDGGYLRDKVSVEYDVDPATGVPKVEEESRDATRYKYGTKEKLTLRTFLKKQEEAADLAQALLDMCVEPVRIAEAQVKTKGFEVFPTDKIKVSRQRVLDSQGSWSDMVLRVKKAGKDVSTESVTLLGIDDARTLSGICGLCVSCQVCVTCEVQVSCAKCDSCESCVDCMICNTAEDCAVCDVCDTCQVQVSCETCDICQSCVSCESCQTCEVCVECQTCDACDSCELCVACMTDDVCAKCDASCQTCVTTMDCTVCDVCDSCETCVSCQASCQSCQSCDATCEQCQTCQQCVECQTCDECDSCESCVACMVLDTCVKCDNCQTCVATMECTVCDQCDNCETCVGCQASCQTCQSCDATCEQCQTCEQCVECQTCDECDSCESCVACMVLDACVKCDNCQTCVATMECTVCDQCDNCETCVSCEASCQSCQSCDATCEQCQTCQSCVECQTCDACDNCQTCVACMVRDSCNKCDSCQSCVGCMICNTSTGECTVCDVCDSCQVADGGCSSCVDCEKCNTCQYCNVACYDCVICEICVECEACDGSCDIKVI